MEATLPENTGPKQARGRWKPGASGNPAGKPPGARHAALVALDAIGAEAGTEIMAAVVTAAKGGDMRAADILLRRLWPERKGRPVQMHLPAIMTAGDIVAALGAVADAVAAAELSPEEGAAVAGIFESQRKAIETVELEQRIAALEQSREAPR
jgi:Family of unknown function (DUF5681)